MYRFCLTRCLEEMLRLSQRIPTVDVTPSASATKDAYEDEGVLSRQAYWLGIVPVFPRSKFGSGQITFPGRRRWLQASSSVPKIPNTAAVHESAVGRLS